MKGLTMQTIELHPGHVVMPNLWRSKLWTPELAEICELPLDIASRMDQQPPPIMGGASFSDDAELKVLNHIFNDGTYSVPTPYLALTTATPDDTKTGSTITEAGYTGYARLAIAAADMSAAAAGSKTNGLALTFAACTASSSSVIGWAVCDALTVGNMIVWGTATTTVISTTQTPATIAVGGLVVNLD